MTSRVLGIDLGTTNTCAAVLRGGNTTVIPNGEGDRTTPSIVAFTPEGERLVGRVAKRQTLTNSKNTVYSIKRFMGRRFCEVLDELDYVPYEVVSASNGDAQVRIQDRSWSPPELSAVLLQKIRQDAEDYLGEPVTQAVITVPAYFNDAQRNATRDAGRIAGLEVLHILNEPTASALAYGLESRTAGRIAVFDFGGGTFDISILEIRNGTYEVRATNGDTHLGGDDIDLEVILWLLETFFQQTGIDLAGDSVALQRLKEAAERAKCELSSAPATRINLPFLAGNGKEPLHLDVELTQSQLERLAQPILDRTEEPCLRALEDAGIEPADIHEVVLVGGATRMPAVSRLVRRLFGRDPVKGVNPDEAVALGAAIQGGILTGCMQDMRLRDVTPLTLGVETEGGLFSPMIKRNSPVPLRKTEIFSTAADNQKTMLIKVFQGERAQAEDNRLLGHFIFDGIRPAGRAIPRIEVSFDIDDSGILNVTARDLDTGRRQAVRIEASSGLAEEDVDRLRREAQLYQEEDRARRDRIALRNQADQALHVFEHSLKKFGRGMKEIDRKVLEGTAHFLRSQLECGSSEEIRHAVDQGRMVLESFKSEVEGRVEARKAQSPGKSPRGGRSRSASSESSGPMGRAVPMS